MIRKKFIRPVNTVYDVRTKVNILANSLDEKNSEEDAWCAREEVSFFDTPVTEKNLWDDEW